MRDGIRFQGLRYMDELFADYIGESVIIRYDPRDLSAIRVFYKNKFLCQPTCANLDQHTIGLKEIQAARNSRRHALRTEIKQRISLVDAILNTKPKNKPFNNPDNETKNPIKNIKLYAADF